MGQNPFGEHFRPEDIFREMFAGGGLPPEFADLLGGAMGGGRMGGGGMHFGGPGMSFSFSSMGGPGGQTFYSSNGGGQRRGHP